MIATSLARRSREAPSPIAAYAIYAVSLIAVTVIAQLLYGRLGYNPTDDGFTLAASRRLIDGQIPHLDFISIRPAGSALLHLPFVLFGGAHTYLISRFFVWFEFATIALTWTLGLRRLMGIERDPAWELPVAAAAFVLCAHYFPIMAWPTIDGLFLGGIGLVLCLRPPRAAQMAGFMLFGAAYLCKQNYVFLAPAAILLLGRRDRWWAWAAAAVPGLAYAAWLALAGALPDAFLQLTTQTGLVQAGFTRFLWEPATAWGLLFGYLAMRILYGETNTRLAGAERVVAGAGIVVALLAAGNAIATGRYVTAPSFGLFALALGATLHAALDGRGRIGEAAAGGLASVAAWCAAISIGYNTPALGCGISAAYLLWRLQAAPDWGRGAIRLLRGPLVPLALALVLFVDFHLGRETFVYLDRPAAELTAPLGDVFPGGAGIRTSPVTHAYLADLDAAIRSVGSGRYAIVPDFAGYWVKSRQPNPLPIDWPQWVELGRPELVARVVASLEAQRGRLTVIVEKIQAATLARGLLPLPDSDRYAIPRYVRRHFRKVGETRFFELYR